MPHYPQQQHVSLHASTVQKKHSNLLIYDQLDEIKRMYAGTGRMPTYTLSKRGALGSTQNKGTGSSLNADTFGIQSEFNAPGGMSAYASRGLAGMHHGSTQQQQEQQYMQHQGPYSEPASPMADVPSAHEALLHQQQTSSASNTASRVHKPGDVPLSSIPATILEKPNWLMPWQTGDREQGRKMADAVRKRRVPGGGFANLDLAKASK